MTQLIAYSSLISMNLKIIKNWTMNQIQKNHKKKLKRHENISESIFLLFSIEFNQFF